jgi:probable rRNA maturation factor
MIALKESKSVFLGSTLKNVFLVPKKFLSTDFAIIKNRILGKKYEVSIILIGKKRCRKLNFNTRKKDYATDVLSFEIEKNIGEIFITPEIAKTKCKKFMMNYEKYLIFLVIHAFLHLKGLKHGAKMEQAEAKFLNMFAKDF